MSRWSRFCGLVGLLLGVCCAASAEDAPDGEPLRARLSALSKSRPKGVPEGALISIGHVLDVYERIRKDFPHDAPEWHERADRYLEAAEHGRDPFTAPTELGRIVSRGYRSPISQRTQGYTVYLPKDYTPERSWPLMIVLHGGSSNGNLFLGVVLGNNMNWKEYPEHLWHRYEPRWTPDWIIAAPDGYGQVLWRFMGEQDVLDVIADIEKHYRVDPQRVVLSGLSNGGMGAYAIGTRHAWRFSAVQAIAGSPSWIFYAGESSVKPPEVWMLRAWSAIDLADNWINTDFRYYHGNVDPGPMRPAYVHRLDKSLEGRDIPHRAKWYDAGHDLLYMVHRHGKIFDELADARRKQSPSEVRVATGDYRAARQHWLEVTRFTRYPELAHLTGKAVDAAIDVATDNVSAFSIDLRSVPPSPAEIEIRIDGASVFRGVRATLGHRAHFVRAASWKMGLPPESELSKRPGLSGPVTDAYFDRMIHVYGTKVPEHQGELQKIAEKGARGWPLWLWTVEQQVVADSALTSEQIASAHLVLYGTPGDNAVLDRIAAKLPIRVQAGALIAGDTRYEGKGLGTRFIYPNPENPERYVIVQTGPSIEGVRRGHNLPDFVPDYVVYDEGTTRSRGRLVPGKAPLARGYFDARWQLPKSQEPARSAPPAH